MSSIYRKDDGKLRLDLIPPMSLVWLAGCYTMGADKYGDRNWEEHTDRFEWSKLMGPALRHIVGFQLGEKHNPESGMPHLAHAACNLMMLTELSERGLGVDDLSKLSTIPKSLQLIWPTSDDS